MDKRCLNKACEELFITRSPLGKTINELEILFGEKLFLRRHGLFQPTDYAMEIYEKTEPLYRKIVNIEDQLSQTKNKHTTQIILDSAFPDNLADIIECSLKESLSPYHFFRRSVTQEDFDNGELGFNSLIISSRHFPVPETVVTECHNSSSFLLITNKELKDDYEKLAQKPLLVRGNMVTSGQFRIANMLEKTVHFTPRVRGLNGTILDFLLMASNGSGFMMLPLITCERMHINREHTILLDSMKMSIYYYYRPSKSNVCLQNIIKHINKLF